MRPALITLIPMLAAAGFVLVGGERLARQEVEETLPADRERLLGFAGALETELDRLDELYLSHLDQLARDYVLDPRREDLKERAGLLKTPRSIQFFDDFKKSWHGEASFLSVASRERLPEIVLEGREPALTPGNSVVLPKRLLESSEESRGWLTAPRADHRIYWTRPDLTGGSESAAPPAEAPIGFDLQPAPNSPVVISVAYPVLVAIVVDWSDLHSQIHNHLTEWIAGPLTPLLESGERVEIRDPSDLVLAATGDEQRGAAALMMPLRTSLGDWQLQAWDGVSVSSKHETSTLVAAGVLSALLFLSGLLLYLQQRRALQLAEERVSFVNRVSHELGAPLTNLTLNLDLAEEAIDTSPVETRRRLGIISEEIERLARLVANVLTFSRRERRTLEIDSQPCIPDEIIKQTLDSFRPALQRRHIEVQWNQDAAERVRLDPDALEQIVGNLLSNAEKYAYDGGWLGIDSQLHDEELIITVADRGPGIPAPKRDLIFKAFERVHLRVNEGSSGTGLGLTIARELAERMGGTLKLLDSEVGTRFELRVPAPPAFSVVPEEGTSAA